MESKVERLVFRNCRECNRVMAGDNYYYEFLSQNGKTFYIMQDPQDNLYKLSEEEYNDAVGINNKAVRVVESKKSRKLKNLLLPLILTGVLTSSLSGCRITNDDLNTIGTYSFSDDEDLTLENKFYYDDYVNSLYIRLKDNELNDNIRLLSNADETFNYDIYLLDQYNEEEFSKKSVLKRVINNYFKHADVQYLNDIEPLEVDYEEEYKILNGLDLDNDTKHLLIETVNNLNALGSKKLSYILYRNIKDMSLSTNSKEYSSFDLYNKVLNISSKTKSPKHVLNTYKKTKYEQSLINNNSLYTIPNNVAYMATHLYQNGYEYSPERIAISFDRETERVVDIQNLGTCLSEGISDYIQYDLSGMKGNRVEGSSINECFYIAFIKMLNITNYDDLLSLNVESFVNRFNELGIVNPVRYIYTLDYQNDNPYYDFTPLFVELLKDYVNAELSNGVSRTEILHTIDSIISTIEERIIITKINNKDCIIAAHNDKALSIGDIKQYINELANTKVKTK